MKTSLTTSPRYGYNDLDAYQNLLKYKFTEMNSYKRKFNVKERRFQFFNNKTFIYVLPAF